MPKQTASSLEGEPLFNLIACGRGGPPGTHTRITPAQLDQIRRTVRRAPEVMVKVLSRASNDLKAAGQHLDYIGRNGELELETDDGERLNSRKGSNLLDDWDLDIDDVRRQATLNANIAGKPPKLVHKLMFSMPPGTLPDKVLGAVRNFAREEFWGQHRYAFVLHTDEAHPHVHLMLKAVSEQGARLNISKATLRHWRSEFARNLRQLGVVANATERAARGQNPKAKKDGIYRAYLRGDSTFMLAEVEAVAGKILMRNKLADHGSRQLSDTRHQVENGWRAIADRLSKSGNANLAAEVQQFVDRMSPLRTDREVIAHEFLERARTSRAPDIGRAR